MKQQKWGLALSGGGARGFLHLGVLQALSDRKIELSSIAGTSIGAIIGAMYAAGHRPEMMLQLLAGRSFLSMFGLKPSFRGFLEMRYLNKVCNANLPKTFEELEIPFYACATNLSSQLEVAFHSGDLHRAVIASASIPILFRPVEIDGEIYVDGGVVNNLPASYCRAHGEKIIGVDCNYGHFNSNLKNIKDIGMEIFHMTVQRNTAEGLSHCDAVIRPYLANQYQMMDFTKAKDLFELGIVETHNVLNKLEAAQAKAQLSNNVG